ncbi:MAG: Lrp/AsnC family transcriptional regulator [Sphingobacteriales bacterium]|nr:Lrp/AsnC family transcriptional regulator [Sphingobacteriales bacterium]OJW32878.1 MAG: AsnC family transcriptional regulator [Sphingobacteriales bacterium 46-32]
MSLSLDEIDLQILSLKQADASVSNADLARQIGMAPSAALERVKKLEQKGVIQQYTARLSADLLGLRLLAFIFIKSSEGLGNATVAKQLAKIPDVLELHHIAGDDCYLVKVRASDPQSLIRLMREKMGKIRGILSTKTTIVLETLKETNQLPVPGTL